MRTVGRNGSGEIWSCCPFDPPVSATVAAVSLSAGVIAVIAIAARIGAARAVQARAERAARVRLGLVEPVAVALIGGGVGWGLRDATAPAASSSQSALSTAALVTSDHQTVGQVFVYNHSPWWTYMSVNMVGQGNAVVTCQLKMADGRFVNVGQFRLDDGYGAWGSSPYTAGPGGAIVGARLLSANGAVLATATFQ